MIFASSETTVPIMAATLAATVGGLVFWANPGRRQNLAVFLLALHAGVWMICRWWTGHSPHWQIWMAVTFAAGAFIPLHLWHVLDSIRFPHDGRGAWRRIGPILGICTVLAYLPFSDWFSIEQVAKGHPGTVFFVHMGGVVACYLVLFAGAMITARHRRGIEQVELGVVILGGTLAALAVIVLSLAGRFGGWEVPAFASAIVILALFLFWAFAITTRRIFDANTLFLIVERWGGLVLAMSLASWIVLDVLRLIMPVELAYVITVSLMLWCRERADKFINLFSPWRSKAKLARQAILEVSSEQATIEELEPKFAQIICQWWQADEASVLVEIDGHYRSERLRFEAGDPALRALRRMEWVSPERLARERGDASTRAVAEILERHKLGLMVHYCGPDLNVLLALGRKNTRLPYTYDRTRELMEVAALIGSAFSRCLLSEKVQRAERLATVGLIGAGVAHEIRNPLVSIKTFTQLLPKHYEDPAFRDRFFRLMSSEVDRIDRLTVQLLEMASPRHYQHQPVPIDETVAAVLELVEGRSQLDGVKVFLEFESRPLHVMADPDGAKQVLLNLVLNALQAMEGRQGERWVRIEGRLNDAREVEIAVGDNGPGISEEQRRKIFKPFHSTRSSGFGLGLSICTDVLRQMRARIVVDPYEPGHGATIRVYFPCPQPTLS